MRHEKKYPPYPVIDMKATGQNLRRLRSEKGYSVADLQAYLGMEYPQAVYHTGRPAGISPAWTICMPSVNCFR